ncbi:MAG: hypothetical protein OMM_09529 [Candidatus Magnetoglobus multicellularis str. Araruama]|uniref:Histidine kinase/HSP90-like ATPase domain-containing protein n=1 Tax=Candidatus Magnetoglobus multicellularis str. Araruama TaxID=890399 RepID=A0A1V1P3X2_9BACT|nr:MAG: hypothetical protein OMM_09529 [Candidatus Magnetoglobus multicellularis str. Araruama]
MGIQYKFNILFTLYTLLILIRNRDFNNCGLDLSICKEIVQIHGGSIKANHSQCGGLQIVIDFPIEGGSNAR